MADAYIDHSGSIAAANVAQTLAPAVTDRRGFFIQNVSDTTMWIRVGGTAAANQPSIQIPAGALYEFPVGGVRTGAISIFCTVISKAFTAGEW